MLNLNKPIVFFDLESTGLDLYNDRIIQIGAIKYYPDGKITEHEWLINPNIPISQEATDIHGLTNEMLVDKPLFGDVADEILQFFKDSDLGGFNVKFYDIPMLQSEFSRIGTSFDIENTKIIDAMQIYRMKEPRNLQAAYEKYVGGTFEHAHNAMADIRASVAVFEGQLKYYNDLPSTADAIHELCYPSNPNTYDAEGKLVYMNGELCINFGKNKNKSLTSLAINDPGYLRWILNGNFSEKVKAAVREVLL